MSALVWDQVGDRRYETGVDHGVLYLSSGAAVVWNGLISVNEAVSREVKPYYIDGIKFLDHHVPGSYSSKLSAFTYPDVLDALIGTLEFAPGVFVYDQGQPKLFNLSYRTRVGNDLEGTDHGYKIHIVYNLLAIPGDVVMSTVGESVEPQAFEFSLYGTPSVMFGIRPTSHVSLESRTIDADLLASLELLLYGSEDEDPALPNIVDLLTLVDAA